MAIDPQSPFMPADPSWWWQTRALPRIVVHPKPPNAASDGSAGAGGIDDWFVPGQAPGAADGPDDWFVPTAARADTYPDDWFVPVPAATQNAGPPPPNAQSSLGNPIQSASGAPDPLAAHWPLIPASRAGAMAWQPPIFLPPNPFSHENIPASKWVTPPPIFLNSPGQSAFPAPAPPATPRLDAGYGLLGALANLTESNAPRSGLLDALANLPPGDTDAISSFQRTGIASRDGTQPALPSFVSSSANLPWSPPPAVSGATGDAGNYASESDGAGHPFLDRAPFGARPLIAAAGFTPPLQISQPANPTALPFRLPSALTSDGSDLAAPRSFRQNSAALDWTTSPNVPGGAGDYPIGPAHPESWSRIQLTQNRSRVNPEDALDPLAPVRTEIYILARNYLRQLQPNNYALSVPSFRAPGGAPTIVEIGELKYAYRIAESTQPLAETASQISGLVDSFAQTRRVVAVLQTSRGTFVAGSGNVQLEDAQRKAVISIGATRVPAAGVDAEIAALKYAKDKDLGEPQFIAASIPFCPGCRKAIEGAGGLITSPTTAVFPRNIPSAFPLR
jgi:hypothetical protein